MLCSAQILQGGDLTDAIRGSRNGELGWYGKGRNIAIEVARGLAFLHSNRIVHCDLKSKNIMLTAVSPAPGSMGSILLLYEALPAQLCSVDGDAMQTGLDCSTGARVDAFRKLISIAAFTATPLTHFPCNAGCRGEDQRRGPVEDDARRRWGPPRQRRRRLLRHIRLGGARGVQRSHLHTRCGAG